MTDASTDEKLNRIISILEEMVKWERINGMGKVEALMKELMKRDVEKLVYDNSDGRTSREIAEASGVSHVTVINYWNKWTKYGLVEEIRSKGGARYQKVFSLSDFGIEVPSVKTQSGSARAAVKQTESTNVSEIALKQESNDKPLM